MAMASLRKRTAELLEALDAELDAQREELKHKTCPHYGEEL